MQLTGVCTVLIIRQCCSQAMPSPFSNSVKLGGAGNEMNLVAAVVPILCVSIAILAVNPIMWSGYLQLYALLIFATAFISWLALGPLTFLQRLGLEAEESEEKTHGNRYVAPTH